ncbi:ATPase, T2SS/T4P/T4SS family [Geodermatophilus obscurus]|uniref:ATPase, T2SS/T4P/T4SS family n=1 Tax=Geodermatophilus obscurus TaxID=1861 RepID=UPI00019B7150|nr:ATPase, T2SS/T4P/T4SS family [Geodermatophilus obscurus]
MLARARRGALPFLCLYGTLIPTDRVAARAERGHHLWYSGKHHAFGGSVQVLCNPGGFSLRVPLPDVVAMQTRQPNLEGAGEIPLRRLVKEALRMRPSRIVVGEVRQEECLDLTQYA